jgi:hypothetical protein
MESDTIGPFWFKETAFSYRFCTITALSSASATYYYLYGNNRYATTITKPADTHGRLYHLFGITYIILTGFFGIRQHVVSIRVSARLPELCAVAVLLLPKLLLTVATVLFPQAVYHIFLHSAWLLYYGCLFTTPDSTWQYAPWPTTRIASQQRYATTTTFWLYAT